MGKFFSKLKQKIAQKKKFSLKEKRGGSPQKVFLESKKILFFWGHQKRCEVLLFSKTSSPRWFVCFPLEKNPANPSPQSCFPIWNFGGQRFAAFPGKSLVAEPSERRICDWFGDVWVARMLERLYNTGFHEGWSRAVPVSPPVLKRNDGTLSEHSTGRQILGSRNPYAANKQNARAYFKDSDLWNLSQLR